MTRMRPERLLPAFLACSVFGILVASAGSLLGLNSRELSGVDEPVLACDTDGISIGYSDAYDAASGRFHTTAATVGGLALGCDTATVSVTLRDASGASLGSGSATVGASTQTVTLSPAPITQDVVGAAVIINGP